MEEEIVKKRIMVIMIWKFGDLEIWRCKATPNICW
jgi:hypothetical protein